MAQKLATIEGFAFDATAMLARMEARFGASLKMIEAATERTEEKVDQLASAEERRHREVMEAFAREKGIEPEKLAPIFEALGRQQLSVEEMRAGAEEAIHDIAKRASQPVQASNDGADIDAVINASRAKLGAFDTTAASDILDAKMKEEEENRKRRMLPLLMEKVEVKKLALDYLAAKATLLQVVELDPDNGWAWVEIGDLERISGTTPAALAAFTKARESEKLAGQEVRVPVSFERIGDVLRAQGDLTGALTHYREALEIARRLYEADESHSERARDVAVSLAKLAMLEMQRGSNQTACGFLTEGKSIIDGLINKVGENYSWEQDRQWFEEQLAEHCAEGG